MSAKTLAKVAKSARHTLVEVAWRQWAAIGGSVASTEPARSVVDPEALVLLSLVLKDGERRLWDVLASWAEHWSRLLSVQRTKNLLTAHGVSARTPVEEFANFVNIEASDARWRQLAGRRKSPRRRKTLSAPPSLDRDAAMVLRLRLGLGVGMRADVLSYLLTASARPTIVRNVARCLDYTGPATRRVLDDLASARMLILNEHERPAEYVVDVKTWGPLLQLKGPLPVWRHWHQVFALLLDVIAWSESSPGKSISSFAVEALGWELLEKHKTVFLWNGLHFEPEPASRLTFAETTHGLCDWVRHHV